MIGSPHPFKHLLKVASVPRTGQNVVLKASAEVLEKIALDIGIPALSRLEAHFLVVPSRNGSVSVKGRVSADLEQLCVVSMEPFQAQVLEIVDLRYLDEEKLSTPTKQEVERTLEDEDPPEPLVGGVIDLGALAVEFVAMALDPFPRKPDAMLAVADESEKPQSPFAVLAALKKSV